MLQPEFYFALTWPQEVWIYPMLTGSCSTIHRMIRRYKNHDIYIYRIQICNIKLYDFQEYIHRVGRTARGEGSSGHALLILRPEELGFLRYLKRARVPVNEYEFSWNKIADIQLQVCVIFLDLIWIIYTFGNNSKLIYKHVRKNTRDQNYSKMSLKNEIKINL